MKLEEKVNDIVSKTMEQIKLDQRHDELDEELEKLDEEIKELEDE